MKTGIVRRIDDLGRVVIPKEIRKSLRMNEGDPLEISIANNGLFLERYVPMYEFKIQAKIFLRTFYNQFKVPVVLCDRYEVITAQGVPIPPKTRITDSLEFHVNESIEYIHGAENAAVPIVFEMDFLANAIIPIATNTDKLGGLILVRQGEELPTSEQLQCAKFFVKLLADQIALD